MGIKGWGKRGMEEGAKGEKEERERKRGEMERETGMERHRGMGEQSR